MTISAEPIIYGLIFVGVLVLVEARGAQGGVEGGVVLMRARVEGRHRCHEARILPVVGVESV